MLSETEGVRGQGSGASNETAAPPVGAGAPEIMTIEQVAEYLQLHPQVVYRHVRAGTLPASRIGRTIRFKRAVLDRFLEEGAWEFAGRYLAYLKNAKGAAASLPRAAPVPAMATATVTRPALETPELKRSLLDESETARKSFSVDVD